MYELCAECYLSLRAIGDYTVTMSRAWNEARLTVRWWVPNSTPFITT